MARSWLGVTYDEVAAKQGVKSKLDARREAMAERAAALKIEMLAPALKEAANSTPNFEYIDAGGDENVVEQIGLRSTSAKTNDPRAAYLRVEIDAYQPLVIMSQRAAGVTAHEKSQTLALDRIDRETVDGFLSTFLSENA